MIQKIITCIVCPVGCHIAISGEDGKITSVTGNACGRGEVYAVQEFLAPARILTSCVCVAGANVPLVSVRSDRPVPKENLFECLQQLRNVRLCAPVCLYDPVIKNILNTGANIVATSEATYVT